jgi:hypothetical protein
MNKTFQILEWKRAATALVLGAVFFALVMILGSTWERGQNLAEALLQPGFGAFAWYYGGLTHSIIDFVGFALDIFLYTAVCYGLLTTKQFVASRRARLRP